jgi:hypothetical protein
MRDHAISPLADTRKRATGLGKKCAGWRQLYAFARPPRGVVGKLPEIMKVHNTALEGVGATISNCVGRRSTLCI